jgi:8-oxo-dGTP diphosphatase
MFVRTHKKQKPRYAGALLVENGQVLLVRRGSSETRMGGLWTLPGGFVEPGESAKSAAEREVFEETGSEVRCTRRLLSLHRRHWTGEAFLCEWVRRGTFHPTDEIEDCAYFPLNQVPQNTVLEAWIVIAEYCLSRQANLPSFSRFVDQAFSVLFYSYIDPALGTYSHVENIDYLVDTIHHTPFRKFKSAIPFLLGEGRQEMKFDAASSELLFSLATIMDDTVDGRDQRYDVCTELGRHGIGQIVPFLITALPNILDVLYQERGAPYAVSIRESIEELVRAQKVRFENRDIDSFQTYFSTSRSRSHFVGRSWRTGLAHNGFFAEAAAIEELQRHTAVLGQSINDAFDIGKRDAFEDFLEKKVTLSVLVLVQEMRKRGGLSEFSKIWNATDRMGTLDVYKRLLHKYHVRPLVDEMVRDMIRGANRAIDETQLSWEKTTVLRAWVSMSEEDFGMAGEDSIARIHEFLKAFRKLTSLIE